MDDLFSTHPNCPILNLDTRPVDVDYVSANQSS
jgi:hypothetical protein